MTYTDEGIGAPEGFGDAGQGDLGGNGATASGEEAQILYPPRRGQEALSKFARWLLARVKPLAQPEHLVTLVVVVVCVVFVFWQFQPSQLFRHTTISGGDTGAHVLLPWVALHQLLPHLRLTGWTSSNWDGFPAVTFYFPLPIYSIVALAELIGNYDVAFKLLTAAPMILMPVAGWLMGRLARAPFPVPAVLAAATLPYIFGGEYEIYGGNILSTLAGEFAFGWSLWFALIFLGLVMRGLQTGRYRAWAAVVLACCFMSHIDPAMFAGAGAVVLVLMYALRTQDWRGALRWSIPSLVVGGLLTAWWALPFAIRFPYVTDMGYQRMTNYIATLFPASDTWLFILAAMGAVLSISRRRRMGEFFTVVAVLAVIAFRYMPQSILWNARVLPFWFLALYLLAGLAVAELYAIMVERTTGFTVTMRAALLPAPLLVMVLALGWVGFPLRVLPGEHANASGNYTFLGIPQKTESVIPSWITWNYSGYQYGCPAACDKSRWPEYQEIVKQLQKVSKTYGCGSLMWEYQSQMNDYGTPDALTILPYWTNGCIGSMEGLYYEASATTPFHFINQSELSLQPSDPMVGLPYASSPNVALGVQHLQMLGVKYYMALNTKLQTQAAADPSLKLISTLGPFDIAYGTNTNGPQGNVNQYWKLYLVSGSPRVRPLTNQPVVMAGLNNASQPKWLNVMTTWYDDPSAWDVYLAATGPRSWARVPYGATDLPVKAEPSTQVSDVVEHNASISFNVSRTGVPVLVSISYFPNWQVSGAEGVYRASPNLMLVVPSSHHVRLWYGTTPVDYAGWVLTLLALVGLVVLARRPLAAMASVRRPGLGLRERAQGPTPGHMQTAWSGRTKSWWQGKELPPWPMSPPGAPDHSATPEPQGGGNGSGTGGYGNGSSGAPDGERGWVPAQVQVEARPSDERGAPLPDQVAPAATEPAVAASIEPVAAAGPGPRAPEQLGLSSEQPRAAPDGSQEQT